MIFARKVFTRFITTLLVISAMFVALTACSKSKTTEESTAPAADVVLNDSIVDDIKSRGYIVVGCKMDVPGLGLYEEETDTWSGIEVELAYEIAAAIWETDVAGAKADNRVQIVGVTVADREDKLAAGEIDLMIATYTITDERAAKFALSNSYYTDYIGIMVKNYGYDNDSLGSVGIHSILDLDGKYIGVPRNATTRSEFINYAAAISTATVSPIFCEFESYEALYKALMDGNIDAMSVDVSILSGYDDGVNTVILSERFGAQHYGVAATLENQKLIEIVNSVIK